MGQHDSDTLIEIFRLILLEVNALAQLLQDENAALKERQVDQIHAVAEAKLASVNRLENLTKRQGEFLSANKFTADESGLDHYFLQFKQNDPNLTRLNKYRTLIADRLKSCGTANEQNGANVEVMGRYTIRALDTLRNRENQAVSYGPDGTPQNTTNSRSRISV